MKAQIDQVGILTSRFDEMVAFYRDVMGFKIKLQLDGHAEFESPGVRFAIGTHKIMSEITGHSSFAEEKKGQSFELAFAVPSPSALDRCGHLGWLGGRARPAGACPYGAGDGERTLGLCAGQLASALRHRAGAGPIGGADAAADGCARPCRGDSCDPDWP